ncbi:MAG: hypothetical protein M3R61_09305 [Chloroflexota bacterium]|nr:hypothetical protein [Chloroflexota bacterium]
MFDDPPTPYQALVLTCALLPWFDEDVLGRIAAGDPELIATLLTSDDVVPSEPSGRGCGLNEALRAAAIGWIL